MKKIVLLLMLFSLFLFSESFAAKTTLDEEVDATLDGNAGDVTGEDTRLTTFGNFTAQNLMNTELYDARVTAIQFESGTITLTTAAGPITVTYNAADIPITAIDDIVGTTVQAVLAEIAAEVATNNSKTSFDTTASGRLAAMEDAATADQTGAEIKALYEAEDETNALTDAEKAALHAVATRDTLGLDTDDNPAFASLHASGGNLAAANTQVTKKWITALDYTADLTSVIHGGVHYICSSTHTAGSTTEPGVGASWATVWSVASGGTDDQNATEVSVDTTNLDNNLSSADDTVQKAIETLDEMAGGTGTDDQTAPEVSVVDNFTNSDGTDVDQVLNDLDDAIAGGGTQLADVVATSPLLVNGTTNADNVLPGADADVTFSMPPASTGVAGYMTIAQEAVVAAQSGTNTGDKDLVDDTTPVLGGNLDIGAYNIEGVTAAVFGYLDPTSSIQDQFDSLFAVVDLDAVDGQWGSWQSSNTVDPSTYSGTVTTPGYSFYNNTPYWCYDGTCVEIGAAGTVATADISDVSVTQAELEQLETIGANTISLAQWTALGSASTFGLTLWDDTDAATARTTLGIPATIQALIDDTVSPGGTDDNILVWSIDKIGSWVEALIVKANTNIEFVHLNSTILGAVATAPDPTDLQVMMIPFGVDFGDFKIVCNGTSTTGGVVTFGVSSTYTGTYTALSTTTTLNGTTLVTTDMSGETALTAGQFLGFWVSTANVGTATACDGLLELFSN